MTPDWRKRLIPVALLGAGVVGVILVYALKSPLEPEPPDPIRPLIRAATVVPQPTQFIVHTQGTVTPSKATDLIPQVSGEVVWVSPRLVAGGFFRAGDPLFRIDRADYEVAVESARANVAGSESEHARAKKERARQRRLADRSVASESNIDDAENAYRVATARLREARSQLNKAERDLARTEVMAMWDGRIRSEDVDVGQFVSRGTKLGRLYAVDYAEVRLPVPDRELAYLDLALDYRDERIEPAPLEDVDSAGEAAAANEAPGNDAVSAEPVAETPVVSGPRVLLKAEFAGQRHEWEGQIVRTEGEIDAKSRMVNIVASVRDPYGRTADDARPPLAVGLFVSAEIEGIVVPDAVVLPRSALRSFEGGAGNRVLVIDAESRLRFRDVEVLRTEREHVVIGAGLESGELVCISPLRAVTEGMFVEVAPTSDGDGLAEVSRAESDS